MGMTRNFIRYGVPIVILYIVARRIDLVLLGKIVAVSNWRWNILGIALISLVIVAGALRWRFLSGSLSASSLTIFSAVNEYWKSLALGVFAPGSMGSDAYRVLLQGRSRGQYIRAAFVIGLEKLCSLFSCAILVACLYPLIASNYLLETFPPVVSTIYTILLLGFGLALLLSFTSGRRGVFRMVTLCSTHFESIVRRLIPITPATDNPWTSSSESGGQFVLSLLTARVLLPAVALSILIYVLSAVQVHLYFLGIGFEIPFLVNIFLSPVIFLLVSLPVSFGGIGLREGGYIVLYGAFGVPMEVALVISFCSLLALLSSYAVGAVLLFLGRRRLAIKAPMLPDTGAKKGNNEPQETSSRK